MDEHVGHPSDTREFMAMWNSVTADHLTHKLAGVVQQLPQRLPGTPPFDEAQAAALAALLIRSFQVAASPDGGVHAAVRFLAEYGPDSSA